jgi:hypothetical protein
MGINPRFVLALQLSRRLFKGWIPAFAGMTARRAGGISIANPAGV